jgi:hypothetical protein
LNPAAAANRATTPPIPPLPMMLIALIIYPNLPLLTTRA